MVNDSFLLLLETLSSLMSFFLNDPATTEIYTLSLHDALPILSGAPIDSSAMSRVQSPRLALPWYAKPRRLDADRKSTRLNSSHVRISYAVFCLKKKNKIDSIYINSQAHELAQINWLTSHTFLI